MRIPNLFGHQDQRTFAEGVKLECPILIGNKLNHCAWTDCNQGALRISVWKRVCQGWSSKGCPDWIDEEGKIIFDKIPRLEEREIELIGPKAPPAQRLLTGNGTCGYLKISGLHGGDPDSWNRWLHTKKRCVLCNKKADRVYESAAFNRILQKNEASNWNQERAEIVRQYVLAHEELFCYTTRAEAEDLEYLSQTGFDVEIKELK